jgi:Fic family protein
MRREDFSSDAPGKLVKTTHGVWAFVPDPPPRSLALNAEAIKLLATAERSLGRLGGVTRREFNPYLISSPLLRREAILSSRIEGTVTTPEQLVLLEIEESEVVNAPARTRDADTEEVLNYVRAMRHGLRRLADLPVSLSLFREVHRVLLSGVRGQRHEPGEFRRSQNFIGAPGIDSIQHARFVPPPVPQMRENLDEFEKYLHDEKVDLPLLVKLAVSHYQFEAIHPFRDGNGRVGRLLIPLIMVAQERLDDPLLYLSAYFERNRTEYVDLLLQVSQEGAWLPWVKFFLRGVAATAEDACQQAEDIMALRQNYHRRFQTDRSSARIIRLIDELFQTPSITINGAARILELSHQGAANNIHKLERAGVLREVTGQRRNQVFMADEILRFTYDRPEGRDDA